MSEASEAMERAEHAAHGGGHHAPDRLGIYIGVTMAILGVILAFCSAFVGSARTDLLQKLVEEEHANANYQAQDVKHRVAFLSLAALHAQAFGGSPDSINKADALSMALTVDRYLAEGDLAKKWIEAFEPVIDIHMESQESYEHALLFAEVGIVLASIALMMKNRLVWVTSAAMGLASLCLVAATYTHTGKELKEGLEKIKVAQENFDKKRAADKTTAQETATVEEIKKWATSGTGAATMPAAKPAPAAEAKGEGEAKPEAKKE